jgi:lysophospholipase L1-like esterase
MFLFLFLYMLAATGSAAPALRIMPLGDSITQWQCGLMQNTSTGDVASFGGYRGPLFANLQREWGSLYTLSSVGGQQGCGSHEGHSGWTCEMLADIITDSATAYKPDVVLLMCGTNDLWYRPSTKNPEQGGTPDQVLERINSILDRLYAVVPDATVLLSTISDVNMTKCATYPQGACPPSMPADITTVNNAMPSKVVAPHITAGRKVFLHDVNADAQWVEKDYWTWGIHRSEAGFAKMAASWEKAILAHVMPPARTCASALDFMCGTAGVRGNATLCQACLEKPFHAKQFKAAKCTKQQEQQICAKRQ